ncbi:unnamed protein product [Penicillium salamii]|uniref:CASTOR ACT domain-containing protein n=1 Tax=Penicillium salamii TaxID=1612424 RepID=A0A9W4JDG6_9EURO|nr:unnamed protein product [Penicillium salamii]CAG8384454.1 unnamed protein product [Penicillium salamii]CAG8403517.1 unnamed protein product [Penicillium salamii]CAG8416751.1 unnamed protein product [Penicillium salamii]
MDSSVDAQVHFLDEPVVLVHIPLELYPYFVKSVLNLIFDETSPLEGPESQDDGVYKTPAFMNISITPVEVSVTCPRRLVDKYFVPVIDELGQLDTALQSRLVVSEKDFIVMQVLGEGLEAGRRVLELTSPLALAGISIFFISTYFSDYIVVPMQSKTNVMTALEARGFQFDDATAAFVSPLSPSTERRLSDLIPPRTPPPSTLAELQTRTFETLRNRQISPSVDPTLRLVQCAAHHEYHSSESSMSILRDALTTVLVVDNPRFLSLTLASLDPAASLLLEKRLLPRFARHGEYEDGSGLLLGSKEDHLIPITLDLRDLPLEASGIVCGVAGRLAEAARPLSSSPSALSSASSVTGSVPRLFDTFGTRLTDSTPAHNLAPLSHLPSNVEGAVEISFLSTARAGTIVVGEDELARALAELNTE